MILGIGICSVIFLISCIMYLYIKRKHKAEPESFTLPVAVGVAVEPAKDAADPSKVTSYPEDDTASTATPVSGSNELDSVCDAASVDITLNEGESAAPVTEPVTERTQNPLS